MAFDGAGKAISSQYANELWFKTTLGNQPDVALASPAGLKNNATLPGWTASHKLSGFAAYMPVMGENSKGTAYPTGEIKPLVTFRGLKGWDPRLDSTYPGGSGPCRLNDPSTWVYLRRPGLWALKWALGIWAGPNGKGAPQVDYQIGGIGAKLSGIDVPAFVALENICDANDWTVAAYPSTDDDKAQVLDAFLQAGGATYCQRAGKISCIQRAAPRTSVVTISGRDTAGPLEIDTAASRIDRINTIRPRYWAESARWQMFALPEVTAAGYQAQDGGKRTRGLDYTYVDQALQATQLAALQIANTREGIAGIIPLKPHLQRIRPGDAFTILEEDFVLNGVKCLCLNTDYDPETGIVRVTFVSETDAKYPFAFGQSPDLPVPAVLTPVDPTLVSPPLPGDWTVTLRPPGTGGTQLPGFDLTGVVSNSTATAILVEYGPSAIGPWKQAYQGPPTVTNVPIDGVQPGATYYIAVSYQRGQNYSEREVYGPYTAPGLIAGDVSASSPTIIQITERVDDLFETYGDTVAAGAAASAAAASAAAADLARSAAQTAQSNSEQAAALSGSARDQAATARNAAQSAQTLAETARDDAQAANTAASTASGLAQSARNDAQAANSAAGAARDAAVAQATAAAGSAGTAAGHANTATSAADTATGQASAASGSALVAQSARDASQASATASSTSASAAATSATAAGSSASAANESRLAAQTAQSGAEIARNESVSARNDAAGSASSASTQAGLAATSAYTAGQSLLAQGRLNLLSRYDFAAGSSYSAEVADAPGATGTWKVFMVGAPGAWARFLPTLYPSTTYTIRALAYAEAGGNIRAELLPGAYAASASLSLSAGQLVPFDWTLTLPATPAPTAFQFVTDGGRVHIFDMKIEAASDASAYTPSPRDAQGYANASLTSANVASSQASAAGSSATVAQSSRLAAEAANAASGNSASAAATSASAASSSATAAGSSASAANQSRLDAQTAQSGAEVARNESVSARNDAQGSASSASTQAGIAATARNDAQTAAGQASTSATAAAGSASSASSSATAAGSSATAAQTSRVAAETASQNAANSASASATSAQAASASESAAGSFSSAADTARIAAQTARGGAESARDSSAASAQTADGHRSAAQTSATNAANSANAAGGSAAAAAGSASSASTSASAAEVSAASSASSAVSASATLIAQGRPNLLSRFDFAAGPSYGTTVADAPGATGTWCVHFAAGGGGRWAAFTPLNFVAGSTYTVRVVASSTPGSNIRADVLPGSVVASGSLTVPANGLVEFVWTFTPTGSPTHLRFITDTDAVSIFDLKLEQAANASAYTPSPRDGLGYANAGVSAAQTASAQATLAGERASAASSERVLAETARGQAQTAAVSAATSESNALGSANSASSASSVSASSRDQSEAFRDSAGQIRDQTGGIRDEASQFAGFANGSASAAATHASTASTQAGIAGTRADAAESARLAAQTARGEAETYSSAAAASASGAAGSESAALSSAGLAARISLGSLNPYPTFALYPGTGNVAPTGWSLWGDARDQHRETPALYGDYCVWQHNNKDGITTECGIYQDGLSIASLAGIAPGYYVLEADIKMDAGQIGGSGVYFELQGGGSTASINFATDKPVNLGETPVGVAGTAGVFYSFRKLVYLENPGNRFGKIHAMTDWVAFDAVRRPKIIRWYRCAIRIATSSEVAAQRADLNASQALAAVGTEASTRASETAALASRVSTTEARATSIPNKLVNSDGSAGAVGWTLGAWGVQDNANVGSHFVCGATGQNYAGSVLIPVYPNQPYTFSFEGDGGSNPAASFIYCSEYDASQAAISGREYSGAADMTGAGWFQRKASAGFTTGPTTNFIKVGLRKDAGTSYMAITRIMLTSGTTQVAWTDQATARDVMARTAITESSVADAQSKLAIARIGLRAAASGSDPAYMEIISGTYGSNIALVAQQIALASIVGGTPVPVLVLSAGRAVFTGNVDINGNLLVNGTVQTAGIAPNAITKEWRYDSFSDTSFVSLGAMTTRATLFSLAVAATGSEIAFDGSFYLRAQHSQDDFVLHVVVEGPSGDVFHARMKCLTINGDGFFSGWQNVKFTAQPSAGTQTYYVRVYHEFTIGSPGNFVEWTHSNRTFSARKFER